jgi:hypothetical protein
MSTTPPNNESGKTDTQQTAKQTAQTRPEMSVEELLNFSFRDVATAKIGNIVRRSGLSCS